MPCAITRTCDVKVSHLLKIFSSPAKILFLACKPIIWKNALLLVGTHPIAEIKNTGADL
jgi:hypothetical protein